MRFPRHCLRYQRPSLLLQPQKHITAQPFITTSACGSQIVQQYQWYCRIFPQGGVTQQLIFVKQSPYLVTSFLQQTENIGQRLAFLRDKSLG